MEKKVVLVTGIGGNVGQGILRNIKSTYPDICIVGTDIAAFTAGNHLCDKTYKVPYAIDDKYIPIVQDIIQKEEVDLIIPSTDYEVYYLAKNKGALGVEVAASEASTAKIYLDKYMAFLHHEEHGIAFAKSWTPSNFKGYNGDIFAKPREGRGSRGILTNPENPEKLPDNYMIQPLLTGKEITCAVYVNKLNKLHGLFTMERELTNGATSKSRVITEYDDELRTIANKMIALKGLRGSFNIQSIVSQKGDVVPFEVNCRISGTNSIRHNLGFQDVKYTIQEYLLNETPDVPNPIKGIAVRILTDVVYPGFDEEARLNNNTAKHICY